MKLKLEITLGNDAMQTPNDVMEAINRCCRSLLDENDLAVDYGKITDINGNSVGKWEVGASSEHYPNGEGQDDANQREWNPESGKEFCAEHGEVTSVADYGSDVARCPFCSQATSTTLEEAKRYAAQN